MSWSSITRKAQAATKKVSVAISKRSSILFRLGIGILVAGVLVLAGLDLAAMRVSAFFSQHQFLTSVLSETILVILVYFLVQRTVESRMEQRWRDLAEPSLRDIHTAQAYIVWSIKKADSEVQDPDKELSIEEAQRTIRRYVDEFERVMSHHRALLAATSSLAKYLAPAVAVGSDSRQFVNDLPYCRGGPRTREWYEESIRRIDSTMKAFEEVYAPFPLTSHPGFVRRLRL